MKQISIKINVILNVFKTVSGIIFPLITYPYILRILQVENVGKYNFSVSIISYFALIAGLGISTYGIREGVQYRNCNKEMKEFVSEAFSINLLSTIFSYVILILFTFSVPRLYECRTFIFILSSEILFTTLGVGWVFNIFEDFLYITIQTVTCQLLSLGFIFILIRSENDLLVYCILMTSTKILSHIVSMIYVRKKYCKYNFVFSQKLIKHIKAIMTIFFLNIAVVIYVSSDTTMLGFFINNYQVGLYSVSAKIYSLIKNVLVAILTVLIPRFTILYKNKEYRNANELFVRVFNVLTVFLLPVATGLFMMSDKIILVFAGESYLSGSTALRILCVAVAFSLYAYMFVHCILIPNGHEFYVLISTVVSAVINIFFNVVLIPFGGINAAAFTTVLAEISVLIMVTIWSQKIINIKGIWKNFLK